MQKPVSKMLKPHTKVERQKMQLHQVISLVKLTTTSSLFFSDSSYFINTNIARIHKKHAVDPEEKTSAIN